MHIIIDQNQDHGQWTCDDAFFQKYPRWAEKIVGYLEDFEPDLSQVDKLNLEGARFNIDRTRLGEVVEAARFKAETDDDFFSPKVEMSDKSLFSLLMIKKGLNFALIKVR